MSDDIVARLREAERLTRNGDMDRDDIGDIIDWCADEIERLRAEVSRLMQVICDSSPDDDYALVCKEADAIWERIHQDNQAVRYE